MILKLILHKHRKYIKVDDLHVLYNLILSGLMLPLVCSEGVTALVGLIFVCNVKASSVTTYIGSGCLHGCADVVSGGD